MTVIELPASRKPGSVPRIASGIAEQKGIDAVVTEALEPVIQSALGIVRESAGLLFHIAGFGVALVSGPKIARPKRSIGWTHPATPESAKIILFSGSKRQATRQGRDQTRPEPRFDRNKS
jgi:hypothetical protein